MTIKLIYSGACDWKDILIKVAKSYDIKTEIYREDTIKDKKKAIQIKASCGAKLAPFACVYDDSDELCKGFYSEVGECTIVNLLKYIEQWRKLGK